MQKKYDEIKMEIRSVLLTYPREVTIEEFLKTYMILVGQRFPSRTLGFSSDIAFLQSIPDVVNVHTDACGKIHLTGIADEKSQHIQKLVSKQRITKPNNKQSCRRQPFHQPSSTNICNAKKVKPFLPGSLRAEILELMKTYQNGIGLPSFPLAYRKKFNKCLPFIKGLDNLEEMIKIMPHLEIKIVNNEKRICYKSLQNVQQQGNPFSIHKSGISDDILENFQKLIQKCSDGILDIHFPPLYENISGKSFDLHELGYNSILDMVDALPHLFKRVLNDKDNKSWIILPADTPTKHLKVDNSSVNGSKQQSPPKYGGIPFDASPPALKYTQPIIPEDIDLTQYVPVFVSAILSPSVFWFQFQTDETSKNFEMFENDLGSFYDLHSNKYKMNDVDIIIGAACIILCPDDKRWYRAIINSIPNLQFVNVSYVDYGSTENIARNNLFYVKSKYHSFPICALKAQLASVKPSQNASVWSLQAQQKFIQLCSNGILMANLKSVNKDIYSVYLCDTHGETDIFLNDVLINEGFADFSYDSEHHINSNNSPENNTEETPKYNQAKLNSSSEDFSRSDQDMQSDKNDSCSESEMLPLNRRLSFSPQKIQSNIITANTPPSDKRRNSRRFVKLLQLCEETKMYFINFESNLYMSCADISKLLWNDKDSKFLIERLEFKEICVPFVTLSKEDHTELFNQCICYRISEYERLKSCNSSLIICPLEWTLNILNAFGHPSVCFRLAIQDEIKRFDPSDPFWKEFYYEDELDDLEKEIEHKISKLCLYDLRAKNEALKIRRLKLLRMNHDPNSEEIKAIDTHQKVIGRRMRQIDAICFQYSS